MLRSKKWLTWSSDGGGGGGVWTLIWDSNRGFFGDVTWRISCSDDFELFFFDDSFRWLLFVLDFSGWSKLMGFHFQ